MPVAFDPLIVEPLDRRAYNQEVADALHEPTTRIFLDTNVLMWTEAELAAKVQETLRIVTEIQDHSEAIIVEGYRRFLTESADPDEREHIDASDQVREVLIHGGYMSLIDLHFCARFDIAEFTDHAHLAEIEALHAEVKAWVEREAEQEAA